MSYLSLSPVSVGVYTALNVAAMTALCPGGVHDDVPQNTTFPFLLYEVAEVEQWGGLGTKPGRGALPLIDLRVHIYTKTGGPRVAQLAMAKAIELLVAPSAISVTGYTVAGLEPFYDETILLPDELIAGQKVQELVSRFRLYVEEN